MNVANIKNTVCDKAISSKTNKIEGRHETPNSVMYTGAALRIR